MQEAINKLKHELELVEADLKSKQRELEAATSIQQLKQKAVLEAQIRHRGLTEAISTLEGKQDGKETE